MQGALNISNQASGDAIRHLEKDMGDLLEVLANNSEISEIILNPYHRSDGHYEGHLLAEYQGYGLCHLIKTSLINISDIVGSAMFAPCYTNLDEIYEANEGDNILFINYRDSTEVLSWINLSKLDRVIAGSNAKYSNNLELINGKPCIKWFILLLLRTCVVEFPDYLRSQLILFAFKLEHNLISPPCLWLNDFIVDILKFLNNNLNQFVFKIKQLDSISDEQFALPSSITVNQDKSSKLIYYSKLITMSATKAETIMSILASITGKYIHAKTPYLECNIPKYGHRFTGVIPPVSNFPAFCIRTHRRKLITLEDLVLQGVLQQSSLDTIKSWIKRRFNILIAGGTGSGKTTLANAILHEISNNFPEERMLIIEDVPELKYDTSYSLGFTLNEFFSMYDALRTTLRFKPDRIIMGEVRGMEAYTLLKAWNTGHPGGVATIHANGVDEALFRFESCIRDHPQSKINRQEIGFTINAIIAIEKVTLRKLVNQEILNVVERKVTALRQIINYDMVKDTYQDIIFDRFEHFD